MRVFLTVIFVSLPLVLYAEQNTPAIESTGTIYQLDLFSLISFGLAITALVVSLFMAWLSWEFYKKSSETSEKTNNTVTKIESSIVGIQNNISEIVNRAVEHWIEGGAGDSNITELKDELYEKFEDLEEKLQASKGGESPEISNEISQLKEQINDLNVGVRQVQVRSLFPGVKKEDTEIEHSQFISLTESHKQEGQINITLNKSIPYATATGKFKPRLSTVPDLDVKLVNSPYENDDEVKFSKGVGTPKDFNIHLSGKGEPLKMGNYIFEYVATINNIG